MGNSTSRENLYDVVIDIQKISDANDGWDIYVNQIIEEKLLSASTHEEAIKELKIDNSLQVVCLCGLFNRGKTHILNQIGDLNLSHGKKVHTKGISFVRPNVNKPILFLDTAGTNSPLDKKYLMGTDDTKPKNDPYAEKKSTELFIQELSFLLADVIVLVVAELTWPDQEFIVAMQKKLQSSKKNYKSLIVIHNFMDVEKEDDLLDMWRECVVSTTPGGPVCDDELVYYKQQMKESNDFVTLHFCIAKEGSEIGLVWNPRVYNYLSSFIAKSVVSDKKPFVELLKEQTVAALKLYVRTTKEPELVWNKGVEINRKIQKRVYTKEKKKIALSEWTGAIQLDKTHIQGHFSLKCESDVQLLHNVAFDGFKILFMRSSQYFTCHYDVMMLKTGMLVTVELPGMDVRDIKARILRGTHPTYPKATVLVIQGKRNVLYLDTGKKEGPSEWIVKSGELINDLETQRKEGEFEVLVTIPPSIEDSPVKGRKQYENGLYSIFLPLKEDDDIF